MLELFKMFKIASEEAEKIKASVNEPHLHDFEELIIGKEGQLEHFIDFRSQFMNAPFVSFVTRGKVHRVKPFPKDGRCKMWVIRFRSEFIPETIFQLYTSFHEAANISMSFGECFDRLDLICGILYREYCQPEPDLSVMRQLLDTLFTMIESERRKLRINDEISPKSYSSTFKNFLGLLEKNYKKPEGVSFYADKLFMSVRNLNMICQHILQQSVSEIIETRKLTEAKKLLITTDMSVSEIGYDLGFKEKTYFSHVFRKRVGMPPKEFRQEMARLTS